MNLLTILLMALLAIAQTVPAAAAQQGCSYNKIIRQAGTAFSISSRPVIDCAVHVVTVSIARKSERTATFKADLDYLAHTVQAVDLTGDGKPEFIVFSKISGTSSAETLDVYFTKENSICRASLREFEDKTGYRGGDKFQIDGRLIVRKIPVYREGDADNKPSGGIRTLKYELKDGRIEMLAQNEAASADIPAVKVEEPSRYRAISEPYSGKVSTNKSIAASKATLKAVVLGTVITEIKSSDAGIEISADRKIENYKVMTLDKPDRIAIDIPGATSSLSGKKIAINKFGISKVRVGNNKGFLRIVLDTTLKSFPKYKIQGSSSGMTVEFSQ